MTTHFIGSLRNANRMPVDTSLLESFGSKFLQENYKMEYDTLVGLSLVWQLMSKAHIASANTLRAYLEAMDSGTSLFGSRSAYLLAVFSMSPLPGVSALDLQQQMEILLEYLEKTILPLLPDIEELDKESIDKGGVFDVE